MASSSKGILARLFILLFASLLQFHLLALDERFLPDEAHFMTFARGAAVQGQWLLPGALDKPPLSITLSAFSMVLVGNTADAEGVLHLGARAGEFAGKLPNALLALPFVALMMRLCRSVGRGDTGALLAGLLAACSPFTLTYGASAFTDMSLLCFVAAALCCGMSQRWGWAGAMLGLALCCKPQMFLAAPLILALMLTLRTPRQAWSRMLPPFLLLAGALLLWDWARPETSLFQLAAANNLSPQLISEAGDWHRRLLAWLGAGAWLLGPPLVTGIVLACLALAWRGYRRLQWLLLAYSALFIAVHTVFNINLYARYLFLLLPPILLLVSGAFCRRRNLTMVLAALVALGGLWTLSHGAPLETGRDQYAGILALAEHLNSKPVATVIYDPWLGWQLDYYLGTWHDKRRVHYPTAEQLAAGAAALDERGNRYFVAPASQAHGEWLQALREADFAVNLDYESAGYLVWRLVPRQ